MEVRVATTTGLTIGFECGGETESTSMVCGELPPGPYTWTVRGIGPHNVVGPNSAPRAFVKQPRLTTAPVPLSPASGSTFDYPDGLGILRWTPVPGAAYYQVQTSSSPTFPGSALPDDGTGLTTEGMVVTPATLGSWVYWRVRGMTGASGGGGPWSSVRSYRVRWTTLPQLVTPVDGAPVSTAILVWEPVDGAYRYDIQLTTTDDPTFADPIATTDSGQPTYDASPVAAPAFLWRVRARTPYWTTSPWSEARLVTKDAGAPPADPAPESELPKPVLTSPADGATNVVPKTTPLDFDWATGALGHDVQIIPASQDWFDPGPDGANGMGGPQIWNLDAGVGYKWRVRANQTTGLVRLGEWSDPRTFTTTPAGTVALLSPADGATRPGDNVTFSWTPLANAPIHVLELSQDSDFETLKVIHADADGRAVAREALAPGTWYWRVWSGRDNVAARSPTRTVTIVDSTPPAGFNVQSNPVASTISDMIGLLADAEDAATAVDTVGVSPDGVTWTEFAYAPGGIAWSLVTPAYGGTTPGYRTIKMRWRDTAGNWSTPLTARVWYGDFTDTTKPMVSAPKIVSIVPMQTVSAGGTLRGRAVWSMTDDTGLLGTQDLTRISEAGAQAVLMSDAQTSTFDAWFGIGHTYRFQATARDAVGNSTSTTGSSHTIVNYPESSSAITYRGSWSTVSSTTQYLSGKARASSVAGATATLRFTGRSIALLSRLGPTRGTASVYVNGVRVATIDTYARTYMPRQVAWSMDWSTVATRTIVVRVNATPGRPRIRPRRVHRDPLGTARGQDGERMMPSAAMRSTTDTFVANVGSVAVPEVSIQTGRPPASIR